MMLTDRQFYLGIALPGLVSMGVMLIVVWRRWTLALPLVLGISVMLAYWFLRRPELPPQDGSDWLFWMQIPLVLGATVFQRLGARWASIGAMAGVVVFVILRPIAPAIGYAVIWSVSITAALWGTTMAIALPWTARRIPAVYLIGALASIIAAAGVLVASSNFLDLGIIGMGAAIAIVSIAVGLGWMERTKNDDGPMMVRGLSVIIIALLAALLAGGRFYPQTGISAFHFYLIGSSPLLIPLAAFLPGKRDWIRGVASVALPSVLVWVIAVPAALTAEHAAEFPDKLSFAVESRQP